MLLNGVIAALVAVTAACGFVAPWAAIVIGFVAGAIAVGGMLWVESVGIDDPIGAVAVHGLAGVWGTLATGIFALPSLASNLATGSGGLVYTGSLHQLGVQALGILAVGAFTFSASFGALWAMKRIVGIRVDAGGRAGRPRRLGTRHVGLSRVLHPGARRLRQRVARGCAFPGDAAPRDRTGSGRGGRLISDRGGARACRD